MLSVCLLMLATWGVSTKWSLELALKTERGGGALDVKHGVVRLIWDRKTHFFNYDQEFSMASVPFALVAPWGKNHTFVWQAFSRDFRGRLEFGFPLGYLIFVGIACAIYYHWSAWIEYPPGHCGHCGYDLSGADHECCPECGAACEDGETTTPARPARTSWVRRTLVLVAIAGAFPTAAWWLWKLTPDPNRMTIPAGSVADSSDALDAASDFLTRRNESPEDHGVLRVAQHEGAWYVVYMTPSMGLKTVEISNSGIVKLLDPASDRELLRVLEQAALRALLMPSGPSPTATSQPTSDVAP